MDAKRRCGAIAATVAAWLLIVTALAVWTPAYADQAGGGSVDVWVDVSGYGADENLTFDAVTDGAPSRSAGAAKAGPMPQTGDALAMAALAASAAALAAASAAAAARSREGRGRDEDL